MTEMIERVAQAMLADEYDGLSAATVWDLSHPEAEDIRTTWRRRAWAALKAVGSIYDAQSVKDVSAVDLERLRSAISNTANGFIVVSSAPVGQLLRQRRRLLQMETEPAASGTKLSDPPPATCFAHAGERALMSRLGTIKPQPSFTSWWKHLRPWGKRQAAKSDRAAAKGAAREEALR